MRRIGRSKIDSSPDLQRKVLDMSRSGATDREIAKELTEKYGMPIAHMTVHNWLVKINRGQAAVLQNDIAVSSFTSDRLYEVGHSLQKLTKLLNTMIDQTNTTKDFKLRAIREYRGLLQQIDEARREFRDIHLNQQQITVNMTAQANLSGYQALIDQLNELEKAGEIKILNPRLRRTNGIDVEGTENAKQDRHNEEAGNQERQPGSDDQHSPGGNDA